jgi:hypothetical protein
VAVLGVCLRTQLYNLGRLLCLTMSHVLAVTLCPVLLGSVGSCCVQFCFGSPVPFCWVSLGSVGSCYVALNYVMAVMSSYVVLR